MMKRLLLFSLLFVPPFMQAQVSPYAGKIDHVIIIIQENRSYDHYFGHFCRTPGNCSPGYPVNTGMHYGNTVTLTHLDSSRNDIDPAHDYLSLTVAIDHGLMDGFGTGSPYSYYDCNDIAFYCEMATTYGLATNYWPMRGPSYPTHYGFIAVPIDIRDNPATYSDGPNRWTCFSIKADGQACTAPGCRYLASAGDNIVNDSAGYPNNTKGSKYHAGVCSGNTTTACTDVNQATNCAGAGGTCLLSSCIANTQGCICPSVTTVGAKLTAAGVSHLWYGPGKGKSGAFWEAPYYEQAAAFGSESSHMALSRQFFTDVKNGTLPVISWITPTKPQSEHPGFGPINAGVAWVQSIIDQCVTYHANCYDRALILLAWDDYGGYYDHVAPSTTANGVRVPLICIGPYCRNTFVSTYLTQAGVLKCVEDVARISYLGPLDTNATSVCKADGTAMIDLSQTPIVVPVIGSGQIRPGMRLAPGTMIVKNDPDVVDGVHWLWEKLHPKEHDRETRVAALKQRECDRSAPLRDRAIFEPTGQVMEWCHDQDNLYILAPGQTLDDKEDFDERDAK